MPIPHNNVSKLMPSAASLIVPFKKPQHYILPKIDKGMNPERPRVTLYNEISKIVNRVNFDGGWF